MTDWYQAPKPSQQQCRRGKQPSALCAVMYDFLNLKKKKSHLSELDLHGEHKGSVTSCHSLAQLRSRLCVASEEWLCGCVDRLHAISS